MRGAQLFEEFCLGHYENGAKFSPRKEHCEITYSQTLSLLPRLIELAKELDVRGRGHRSSHLSIAHTCPHVCHYWLNGGQGKLVNGRTTGGTICPT
jgi:hypothetical protein